MVTTTTTSSQITTTVKPSTVRPVDEKTTSSPTRPVDGITTASSQTTQKKEISQSPSTFAPMDYSSVVIEGSLRPTSLRSTVEDKGQGGGVVTVEVQNCDFSLITSACKQIHGLTPVYKISYRKKPWKAIGNY